MYICIYIYIYIYIYSMTGIKGLTLLSQWSNHVQIWHVQRKQSELGYILSNFFVVLNILASRRGWSFWGVKCFEVLKKKRGSIWSERQNESMEWDSEMTQKLLFLNATLFLKLKWIEIYILIHYNFFHWQNWSKSNTRFFAYHYNSYNKLSIVNFSLPKVS